MTPSGLLDLLAAIMLAVTAASVARVVAGPLLAGRPWRPVREGTDIDVSNVLMGIAMAGMLVPGLATLPNAAWDVLFGLLTAWFACRAWADARNVRALAADRCTLHVVHCAAMLYMFLALGTAAASGGMGGPAMQTLSYPTLAGAFVLLLVAYSVWDLNQLSGRRYILGWAGGPATDTVVSGRGPAVRAFLLAPGTRVGWDVVLGITMAFMLVTMI
jgi:hypothetical protein